MSFFLDNPRFPEDLKLSIFNDYIKYNLEYNKLTEILESNESHRLNISLLLPYLEKNILNDQKYISFLLKNNNIFKNIYTSHYIDNNKCFVLMNVNDSCALSWLMYLYH
jgi:hypothetical protein